jgi:hypothetical protein
MMSDVHAVTSSAAIQPGPHPREKPRRDDDKDSRPRRERPSKPTDAEISDPEVHKLNVSA